MNQEQVQAQIERVAESVSNELKAAMTPLPVPAGVVSQWDRIVTEALEQFAKDLTAPPTA